MEKEKVFKAKVWEKTYKSLGFSKKSIIDGFAVITITLFAKYTIFGEAAAMTYLEELFISFAIVGALFLFFKLFVYWIKSLYAVGKEQDEKLEILNWNKIDFTPCEYRVFNNKGWGIAVTNNKKFDIGQINLEIIGIKSDGEDIFSLTTKNHELGRIENSQDAYKEEIYHSTNGKFARINSGKTKVFPITNIVTSADDKIVNYFLHTFPESERDIEWPFSTINSDDNIQVVVLKIKVECAIIEKEAIINKLHGDYVAELKSDGSLLPYKEKETKNGRKKTKSKAS